MPAIAAAPLHKKARCPRWKDEPRGPANSGARKANSEK